MIWGTGSGRCGTKSLAKDLGGLHEPQPWLLDLPRKWAEGDIGVEHIIVNLLRQRMGKGVPTVDLSYTYIIPLIYKVDPAASFIVVYRNPIMCIGSFMAGGIGKAITDIDPKLYTKHKKEIELSTKKEIATAHWITVYDKILEEYNKNPRGFSFLQTEELESWENKNNASWENLMSREDAAWIMEKTMGTYGELLTEHKGGY